MTATLTSAPRTRREAASASRRAPERAKRVPLVAAGVVVALAAAAAVVAWGPGGVATEPTRLVLVSGRDDHGLLARETVPFTTARGGVTPAGDVPDGTIAKVVEQDGTQLLLTTLEGRHLTGWTDDFYLRGVVHLVGDRRTCDPSIHGTKVPSGEQVMMLEAKGPRVKVRSLRSRTEGWVPRSWLSELVPSQEVAAADGHHHGPPDSSGNATTLGPAGPTCP